MQRTKIALAIIIGIILATGVACSCKSTSPTPTATPSDVNVDASYNSSEVTLAVGKQLILTLRSHETTGYTWNLSAISDTTVIHKVRNTYEVPTDGLPISTWYFEALAAGTATISMKEFRSGKAEPDNIFEITVIVE